MRAVIQRVEEAWVQVDGETVGSISKGVLVYLGIQRGDELSDADYLCEKILSLRIFEDEAGKMNLSLRQVQGEVMIVSQFTLYGDCRRGNRPSFSHAASPEKAQILYHRVVNRCKESGLVIQTGNFRKMMRVYSVNDGPVTMLLDSEKLF